MFYAASNYIQQQTVHGYINYSDVWRSRQVFYLNLDSHDWERLHGRILLGCVSVKLSLAFVPLDRVKCVVLHVIIAD